MPKPFASRIFSSARQDRQRRLAANPLPPANPPPEPDVADQSPDEIQPADIVSAEPGVETVTTEHDQSQTGQAEGTAARITLPGWAGLPAGESEEPSEFALPGLTQPRAWEPVAPSQRLVSRRLLVLLSLASLAIGVGAGFLIPRPGAKPKPLVAPVIVPEETRLLTPADQDELDAAYAARKAGDFVAAATLFDALERKHPNWASMKIEKARTRLYQQDFNGANRLLQESAIGGVLTADANFNLGLLYLMRREFSDAEASFARATALDPSVPDIYYFWGECLRGDGKPREAARRFHSALLRNQFETSEGLYRIKYWLSQIESGQEESDGVSAEIDAALALPRPPMEALFAAAARELKARRFDVAATRLLRARELVEPSVFKVILADPLFAQERSRPELAEIFKAAPSAPRPDGK